MQGNLCRCTGYRPILEGYSVFAKDGHIQRTSAEAGCPGIGSSGCCRNGGGGAGQQALSNDVQSSFVPLDQSQEPIFPPELNCKAEELNGQPLVFKGQLGMTWFRPCSLKELLELKRNYPEAKLVVGNTELGIEMKFKKKSYPVMIQPNKVQALQDIKITDEGLLIGSSVTLSTLKFTLESLISARPKYTTRIFHQIIEMLRWFAGEQIRNVGSVGGNIMTGSPISDLNPIFMACKAMLTLASIDKTRVACKFRQVPLDQHFYTGYRKTLLEPDEVLVDILIPFTKKTQHFVAFKQARRRDDDIAIVNGAFFYNVDRNNVITEANMAFGGLSYVTKLAQNTCTYLKGKYWYPHTFEKAMDVLLEEFPLPPNVPGAMVRYRQTLAMSLFFKSFLTISETSKLFALKNDEMSAAQAFHKDPVQGSQLFEVVQAEQSLHDPLRRPLKHKSADKQTTGEAVYVDDIPRMKNELYLAFVLSSKARAKILNIDSSSATKEPGVIAFYSSKDISPQKNVYRMIIETDEWLFAAGEVHCVGQVIGKPYYMISVGASWEYQCRLIEIKLEDCIFFFPGVIVAKSQEQALKAADMVQVDYQVVEQPVVTIEESIEQKSFHPLFGSRIKTSEQVDSAIQASDIVIQGQLRSGAQEHFYMEPQSCLAVPTNEDGEMIIYSSTQNPTETQRLVAHALDVPMNRVVAKVKRLGGGFGGKESRSVPLAMAVAFAASKTHLPVRACLDRDQDMLMCGQRHPFFTKYQVGCNKEGLLQAIDVDIYNNAGYSLDLSFSVMHR